MDPAWYQPIAFGIFIVGCILLGLLGVDSRPGFSEWRSNIKEHFFVHSKDEYRR
jgi:hypothetical protein